jgi:ferric-dicitrate binding protein FerR (iron transport regulator)
MNRGSHRIVYNRRRGQWMAVAETAPAAGKGAQDRPARRASPREPPRRARLTLGAIGLALYGAFGVLPQSSRKPSSHAPCSPMPPKTTHHPSLTS